MNTALWILQGILASTFIMTGTLKLIRRKADIEPMTGFVEDFTKAQTRGIGLIETIGATGLILPR